MTGAPLLPVIFFGGKRIARLDLPSGAVHYYFSDHLGSSNVVTNSTGTTIEEESDFYPFGGERVLTDLLPDQRYKFTGKERDPETGLDYFGARYYSSSLGRFITPDEFSGGPVDAFSSNDPAPSGALPYADITNPQSLNKYTYTYNNPLRYTDPDGHAVDIFADVAAIAYDASAIVADLVTGSDELGTDVEALAADVVGAAVPFVTGLGMAVRAAKAADKVNDAAKAADRISDAAKAGDKVSDATKAIPAKPPGENAAAKAGREAHKSYNPGPGFKKEVKLASGRKADAVNNSKAVVKELKPNNPKAVRRGERQVERNRQELQRTDPKKRKWKSKVDTYDR